MPTDPTEEVDLLADGISSAEATIVSELTTAATAIYQQRGSGPSDPGDPGNPGDEGYAIVDTGQNQSYDSRGEVGTAPLPGEDLYGQDAQHQGLQPSYHDNGDGTVSDLVTGLMWSQTPDLNGDDIINVDDQLTYTNAMTHAESMGLAGYEDWRVPTIKELAH